MAMYPKKFFSENVLPEEKGTVFVLMPFASEFDPIFDTIKRILEGEELQLRCYRADEVYKSEPIIETILRGILRSELIIADVTGRNPNVLYELGIAHAVKDNCIIITQSMEDVPFDLRHLHCIVYENSFKGSKELRLALTNAVRAILSPVSTPEPSPCTELFGKVISTELSYETWITGYKSDYSRIQREAEATRRRLFEKATAAIAAIVGLEATKIETSNRLSFSDGFALSEIRDESVGGPGGVRFAVSLLLAVNTNKRFNVYDIAAAIGKSPHRVSFIFDRALDIPAIFRLAKERGLGFEGLSSDSVEISLDPISDSRNYREKNWRLLATNRSGTGRIELFKAERSYRGGPWPIEVDISRITPERIFSVLKGSLPLAEFIGAKDAS